LKLLVLDAYAQAGRAALREVGATEAGPLYAALLGRLVPDAQIDVACAADPDPGLPVGVALSDYDGAVWTGSSLTIHHEQDPHVTRQINLARSLLAAGVPCFGSCWAAQVAVTANGGSCAANPKGREFGIARRIELSAAGREHPLFEGKPAHFDAFTSHVDEVRELPAQTDLLASNDWCRVQAVDVPAGAVDFWAVQYHPEYDAAEVAALTRLRADELVAQGTFADRPAADAFARDLDEIASDPTSPKAAERGFGDDLLDESIRTREVANWLRHRVRPHVAGR
jgi:GMP synthase (glutamine-hydrolysing)